MKKQTEINPEAFEKMLLWLDQDRDIAGQKYEAMRLRLIKIFNYRQALNSEELADLTFDRVLKKFAEDDVPSDAPAAAYFYRVADFIHRESLRKPVAVEMPDDLSVAADEESFDPYYECLRKCLKKLSAEKHRLIVSYYEEEKRAKIDFRQKLAQSIGIPLKKLHSRVFRIRTNLQQCVINCVKQSVR